VFEIQWIKMHCETVKYVYLVCPLEYLIKKLPIPTKRATVGLINVKSCNALLDMPLVYIRSYLNSGLWYKFLILETRHPDSIFMFARMWGSMCYFSKQTGVHEKKVWEKLPYVIRPIWGWGRYIGNFLEWYVVITTAFRFRI